MLYPTHQIASKLAVLNENVFVLQGELYATPTDMEAVKTKMHIEKKLILCSILAVVIGISTVTPLAFLMTPATAQSTDQATVGVYEW